MLYYTTAILFYCYTILLLYYCYWPIEGNEMKSFWFFNVKRKNILKIIQNVICMEDRVLNLILH